MLIPVIVRCAAWLAAALLWIAPQAHAQTAAAAAAPRVLALYDSPVGTSYEKLGLAYAVMLRNLLGHFSAQVTMLPVASYTAGAVDNYDATFYLGSAYDHPLPASFLADAATTTRRLVWFKYNLWQLAWNPAYGFQAARGIDFRGLRGMNAVPGPANPAPGFFSTVRFKGLDFVKYYAYDAGSGSVNADPDVGITSVTDPARASVVTSIANPSSGETAPYMVRSQNFWYVADIPLSFIGPRDRYLVFADALHDMLGIVHAESHRALVRLEDVDAQVSQSAMKKLTDYLRSKNVPFTVGVIPHYLDPLGHYSDGVPQDVSLSEASTLKKTLDYALQRGGELVMHGFTHQYGRTRNPYTGASGDDFEFWDATRNLPVAEDATAWVLDRVDAGLRELTANGYRVFGWETPHYQASAVSYRAFAQRFAATYQRAVYYTADSPVFDAATGRDFAVGQSFPYGIAADHYGQRIVPENLGNLEYDLSWLDPTSNVVYTADDILANARYARSVRDGYASFFFHSFLLDPALKLPALNDFRRIVEAISALGFAWVRASAAP